MQGCKKHCPVKCAMKIAKLVFTAVGAMATVCVAKELHKVHKAIEHSRKH